MTFTVGIVGAGALGSRHLQGLSRCNTPLTIHVADIEQSVLRTAQERYEATGAQQHQVTYGHALDDTYDVIIVATTAGPRAAIIKELASNTRMFVIEKLLFTQPDDYRTIPRCLSEHKVLAWVNCPMRMTPLYTKILDENQGRHCTITVSGGSFGLVTGAIHDLDYFELLTGGPATVDASQLDAGLIDSKRTGYKEATGTLQFRNGDSRQTITCLRDSEQEVRIEITTPDQHLRINKREGMLAQRSGSEWQQQEISIPLQSELTGSLVEQLLAQQTCPLPTFDESCATHLRLLEPIREHFNLQEYPFT